MPRYSFNNTTQVLCRDLNPRDESETLQAATLLLNCFAENWPEAWPDLAAATQEVMEACQKGHIYRAAFESQGQLVGWIAGQSSYQGRVWELHPLVIASAYQSQGTGTALVADFENLRRHPYEFYQKLGYQIVGVIPDANGRGKPDILMIKKVTE